MDLLGVKKEILRITGRYDLVVSRNDLSDAGILNAIHEGQKHLENMYDLPILKGRMYKKLQAGKSRIDTDRFHRIDSVYYRTSSEEKFRPLEKAELPGLLTVYPDFTQSAPDGGRPFYWDFNYDRLTDDSLTVEELEEEGVYVYDSVNENPEEGADSILVRPVPNQEGTVMVLGLMRAKVLEQDADTNYWTVMAPKALVYATCLFLEGDKRNTEGTRDWANMIDIIMLPIAQKEIEKEDLNLGQMRG